MTDKTNPTDTGLDQAGQTVATATQTVDAAQRTADTMQKKLESGKQSIAKVQKLTTDARNLVAAVMNMATSVAVVISVLLGAKNVNVADRQLSLANEQLAALDAAESRSTARSQEWLKALERMRVEQAVQSGVAALVAHFVPPDELIRSQPASKVEIAIQSLLNEPLNGRIHVEVKGSSRSMMCMLPGCMDPRSPGCECHDPLNYNFVLEPMHMLSVNLPIALQPDPNARCSEELVVEFEIEIQDAKSHMKRLDKRQISYRRAQESSTCGPHARYQYLAGDSWDGTPVVLNRRHDGDDGDDGADQKDAGADQAADTKGLDNEQQDAGAPEETGNDDSAP